MHSSICSVFALVCIKCALAGLHWVLDLKKALDLTHSIAKSVHKRLKTTLTTRATLGDLRALARSPSNIADSQLCSRAILGPEASFRSAVR